MANMYKVENPVYLDYAEMWEKYEGNMIVITNIVREGEWRDLKGGIVRYYGKDKKGLLDKWVDVGNIKEYGERTFEILVRDKGDFLMHDET